MTTDGSPDKAKAIDLAIAQIEKQYGKGAIMRLGEDQAPVRVDAIPTGSISLDAAIGIGGVPRGRVVEIFGPEASGKTTLALHIIAEAQRRGGVAAFIDAEHALSLERAQALGVNIKDLFISQPDTGEEALEITDTLVRSGAFDVIVIDSVAALVPRAELEGEMGDSHVGLQARLMSQALRKLTGSIHKSKTCVIFINQIRMKIGITYGSPETTTGGRALKFYASVIIDIRPIAAIKDSQNRVIGRRTKVKIVKNKVAPPFRETEFDMMFEGDAVGISKEGDLLDLGTVMKIIEKSGTWFSYNGERLGQGRENVKVFFRAHPEIAAEVEDRVRAAIGGVAWSATASSTGVEEESEEGPEM
jgi:recombination protein RecA